MMKKIVVGAALFAATWLQPVGAAVAASSASCYSPSAIEAEEAIRFVTDIMVVSTQCQDTVYGQFRLRNKDAIIAYQKALIAHFRGNAAFDSWNTSLANEASRKQAGLSTAQICQQAIELMKTAASLDVKGFKAYAASQAASASPRYAKCGK